jgi:TonB family protein
MNSWMLVVGWTLIHFVWQGAVIAAVTAAGLRLCRPSSAQARYAIACVGLATMLASPPATAATAMFWTPGSLLESIGSVSAGPEVEAALRLPRINDQDLPSGAAATQVALGPLLLVVAWGWLAGVALLLARFAGGCWRIQRLQFASIREPASRWQEVSDRLGARLRLGVAFRVVESMLVDAPTVIGWLRPIILLPVAALTNLAPGQIEAILAHELAHIRRRDYAVNLLQTVAETLLFYHPGVWWVSARVREEREYCCDDVAVAVCGEPREYAAALAELAAWRNRETALAVAATDGALLSRVRRLMHISDDNRPRSLTALVVLASIIIASAGVAVQSSSLHIIALQPAGRSSFTSSSTLGMPGKTLAAPDWHIFATDHFDIYYEPEPDLHIEQIGTEVERAYARISSDLKHELDFKVQVILFRTTGAQQHALNTGTMKLPDVIPSKPYRVLLPMDYPAGQRYGLMAHEITHVFGFDIIPGGTSRAIAEGLAEYERGSWDPGDVAAVRAAVRAQAVPDISSFSGEAGTDPRLVYGFGHAMFDFIESRWGKNGVRQFLFGLRRPSTSGDDPYEGALQVTRNYFERAYEEYLRQRFGASVVRPSDEPTRRGVAAAPGKQTPAGQTQNEIVYASSDVADLPTVVTLVKPEYTSQAQEAGIQGSVILDAVIQSNGEVGEVTVQTSLDSALGLDDQAIEAMKQWVFRPALLDGIPVAVLVQVEMTFTLK